MHRQTWLEIDLAKIKYNIQQIQAIQKKDIIAVLKANAYGCGDVEIAHFLKTMKINFIAVSSVDEAIVLREHDFQGKILVLGGSSCTDIDILKKYHITVTAYSLAWVQSFIKYDLSGIDIHLKVDTGMNRIGFDNTATLVTAMNLLQQKKANIEGIFTHYYLADTDDKTTNRQFNDFKKIVLSLHYPFQYIHADNSDASLSFKDTFTNAIRLGIGLYGYCAKNKILKEALSLYTKPIMIKEVLPGETIGYGASYKATTKETIATLPIGYADGLLRINQGRKVFFNGHYGTIVGRICMDQCMVKVDHPINLNDTVEIFGQHISLMTMAKEINTIPYEIITLLSSRVTRIYKNIDQQKEENWRYL